MNITTTKINAVNLKLVDFLYTLKNHEDHHFFETICIEGMSVNDLVKEFADVTIGDIFITGKLNLVLRGKDSIFSRADLQDFIDTIDLDGTLEVAVYYEGAGYPCSDEGWDSVQSVSRLGNLSIMGNKMPHSAIYEVVIDGISDRHIRTDGMVDDVMSAFLELVDFKHLGLNVIDKKESFTFDIDANNVNAVTYTYSEISNRVRTDERFVARVLFTHAYLQLVKNGTVETSIKTTVEMVEEYYKDALHVVLRKEILDYPLFISSAMAA